MGLGYKAVIKENDQHVLQGLTVMGAAETAGQ